ncbi:MAG: hypothetical protein JWP61_2967 [Friedmanniella sp.]|nr:hypothetical protein [Friedmanniella sp.]
MRLFERLLDDTSLLTTSSPTSADQAVAAHRERRHGSDAALFGPLVVPDDQLAAVGRHSGSDDPTEVSVRVTGGAGGLLALAGRQVPGVRVVAAQTVLRDLDDLAQNAARVVSAAGGLDPGVRVFVGLPRTPRWVGAVEVVEAAGLAALISPEGHDDAGTAGLVEQLSVLIEADLPFTVAGPFDRAWPGAGGAPGYLPLLMTVEALVDGANAAEARALLGLTDRHRIQAGLAAWDTGTQQRVRRRIESLGCGDVATAAADLGPLLTPA